MCRDRREEEDDQVQTADDREPAEITRQSAVPGDRLEAERERPEAREPKGREAAWVRRRYGRQCHALLDRDGFERPVRGRKESVPHAERCQPPSSISSDPCRGRGGRDRRRKPSTRYERRREGRGLRVLRMIPNEAEKHHGIHQ